MTARVALRGLLGAAALTLLALLAAPAVAHDARPVSVELSHLGGDRYAVRIRIPDTVAADNLPELIPPSQCRRSGAGGERPAGRALPAQRFFMSCPGGLRGETVAIAYPLYNPSLSTLFRLRMDGAPITRLQPPDRLQWTIPARRSAWRVFADYMQFGIGHIFAGYDHLLFVAGLLLLARSFRRVLLCVTGFTLAHSLTLALSALDVVRLPGPPVEAAIALSILFVAREIIRPTPGSLTVRFPALVASLFGLLHGFGFASALRELGLAQENFALSLFGFNLGVEIGQLVFIGVLMSIYVGWRHVIARIGGHPPVTRAQALQLGGYAIGVPAAFWFVERTANSFGLA